MIAEQVDIAEDTLVAAPHDMINEGSKVIEASMTSIPGPIGENAGTSTGTNFFHLDNASKDNISSQDIFNLASQHALSVIDGAHLMSEEGIELWVKHFAPSPTQVCKCI